MIFLITLFTFLPRIGKEAPPEPASPIVTAIDGGFMEQRPSRHDTPLAGTRSGQILWIRGLTRLQTQVGYICMFVFTSFYTLLHIIILIQNKI